MLGWIVAVTALTFLTFMQLHIENIEPTVTLNASCSVEEGSDKGAVVDMTVHLSSQKILIDKISDGLFPKNPISGEQVRLKDCQFEETSVVAF